MIYRDKNDQMDHVSVLMARDGGRRPLKIEDSNFGNSNLNTRVFANPIRNYLN